MLHARQDFAFRCSIALQLISDDDVWDILHLLEQPAEESFRRLFVPSSLHQDIQHVAILIYRSQGMVLAPDCEEDARPYATYPHSEGDDGAVHWRRSAQTSNTIARPFHSSRRSHIAPEALPHHEN